MICTDLILPIGELVQKRAQELGNKVAWSDARSTVTFQQLDVQTANLAGHLQEAGLQPGDHVAIYLPNSVEWVVSCLAIARAGLVSVPISHDAAPGEVTYRINDSGSKAVITTIERLDLLAVEAKDIVEPLHIIVLGSSENKEIQRYESLIATKPAALPRDPKDMDAETFIIYTSGTTGAAKGVRLSTRSMLWVVAACWAPITGLCSDDRVLSPLPLFHSYALNFSVLAILATGASEHIMEKYSSQEVLRLLKTGEFTVLPGVPTMFHYILEAAKQDRTFSLSGMRLCLSAGAILPADLNREFEDTFGIQLLDGYGITETSTMVTMNAQSGTRIFGSCGLPVPGVATRIINPTNGMDVPIGEEGELIVRGPNLMLGYHNKPTETEAALQNGWYHTGDLARSDAHGYLTITGRLKEVIIRGGQNISPGEVEDAVRSHPNVLDCAAVGLPHQHLGEVPAIFVIPRPGLKVDVDDLLKHCRTKLSSYKVPASVHVVDEIPRTGSGKIMRFKLKALA